MSSRKEHWERVYLTKASQDVSWFQAEPTLSLRFIDASRPTPATWIIDVGGGDSRLVDYLLARGMTCVTVLDISGASLCRAKDRLGAQHECVSWIEADVTAEWEVPPVAIWHDRAVFHFLTDPNDRARYVRRLRQAVKPGGTVILATFAPDGPEKCSGLPVQRYDAAAVGAELGDEFRLVANALEQHRAPSDIVQLFCYVAFRRDGP